MEGRELFPWNIIWSNPSLAQKSTGSSPPFNPTSATFRVGRACLSVRWRKEPNYHPPLACMGCLQTMWVQWEWLSYSQGPGEQKNRLVSTACGLWGDFWDPLRRHCRPMCGPIQADRVIWSVDPGSLTTKPCAKVIGVQRTCVVGSQGMKITICMKITLFM